MAINIHKQFVDLSVADGTHMQAYVARPEGAMHPLPAILVLQEIFGVNTHIREVAERFARAGFVALAPELFHRAAAGYDCPYTQMEKAMVVRQAYTDDLLRQDLDAAYAYLKSDPDVRTASIAAVGFCMGGRAAVVANGRFPLNAAISFYGARVLPGLEKDLAAQHGPIHFFWAGKDHLIPVEQSRAVTDALRAAGKEFVSVEYSNADHGFFCDARANYDAAVAPQAWAQTLNFLRAASER
ncbi:MAG: dienelactone hydrolase family protein [Bdellovibrionales bacterium]|nr:dienelactone hydrolase family protein [Bdellovibrionales bacterium]